MRGICRVAWALSGSELWVAGQRVMPDWVRGRMNSFQIMLGQGGIAIGALIWGSGVAHAGPGVTFAAAAALAVAVFALGSRFSINFAAEASVDAAGDSEPVVCHYLATQRRVHLHGYGFCGRTFVHTAGSQVWEW